MEAVNCAGDDKMHLRFSFGYWVKSVRVWSGCGERVGMRPGLGLVYVECWEHKPITGRDARYGGWVAFEWRD